MIMYAANSWRSTFFMPGNIHVEKHLLFGQRLSRKHSMLLDTQKNSSMHACSHWNLTPERTGLGWTLKERGETLLLVETALCLSWTRGTQGQGLCCCHWCQLPLFILRWNPNSVECSLIPYPRESPLLCPFVCVEVWAWVTYHTEVRTRRPLGAEPPSQLPREPLSYKSPCCSGRSQTHVWVTQWSACQSS